ncbi:hypothetical protein D9758_012535 [Tetrapyrgos nigripes]|uniref:Uncharacterized protein n=1 Tax=Tetrapyrgos nigripes TaxID=182062 RepID=A0A8H5LHP5_9AGAR|nr:hypothetical protein D9758_012535 [Tetrapyrgos nigripes]
MVGLKARRRTAIVMWRKRFSGPLKQRRELYTHEKVSTPWKKKGEGNEKGNGWISSPPFSMRREYNLLQATLQLAEARRKDKHIASLYPRSCQRISLNSESPPLPITTRIPKTLIINPQISTASSSSSYPSAASAAVLKPWIPRRVNITTSVVYLVCSLYVFSSSRSSNAYDRRSSVYANFTSPRCQY